MAAADAAVVAAEIAASLTMDEIPVKLRCAGCNRLAVNAFRMPCCDQSVCETCQASLGTSCPICLHDPVQVQDCKPNKTLRATVKAFLRKKAMDREAARKKEKAVNQVSASDANGTLDASKPGAPSVNPSKGGDDSGHAMDGRDGTSEAPIAPAASTTDLPEQEQRQISTDSQMDIPRPSIETSAEDQLAVSGQNLPGGRDQFRDEQRVGGMMSKEQGLNGGTQVANPGWPAVNGGMQGMPNGMPGFDPTKGGFPNMDFNGGGDFNQMMQLMQMQNGMPNNLMGAFPNMMGMPGMGMDPTTMAQSMYGGFGGQGMGVGGMNGMNGLNNMNGMSGMNMGMDFSAGQGNFGGYNGQPDAWNAGQDNFNPNAYGGHANGMNGDFGAHSGYGGYNMPQHQGNYNQMNHHHFPNNEFQHGYNRQGFQDRGRGRRGGGYHNSGRGRGGYNQGTHANQAHDANFEPFHHQIPSQLMQRSASQQSKDAVKHQGSNAQQAPAEAQQLAGPQQQQASEEIMNKELNTVGEEPDYEPESLVFPATNGDASDAVPPVAALPEPENAVAQLNDLANDDDLAKDPVEQTVDPETSEQNKPAPIETFISSEEVRREKRRFEDAPKSASIVGAMPPPGLTVPLGPASQSHQDPSSDVSMRGKGQGRGPLRGSLDTRSRYRSRGAGHISNGSGAHSPSSAQSTPTSDFPSAVTPTEPKGLGVEGAPKAPKALREGHANTIVRGGRGFSIVGRASAAVQVRPNGVRKSKSPSPTRQRSPSRSRSTSPHRSGHHRSHRHRSRSESNEDERERRKERHRRRSRREDEDEVLDGEDKRQRDGSVEMPSRRSSHRSHRHHEKESESDGRRHHRERSRDREEDRRHRRKRSRSPGTNDTKHSVPEFAPPTGPASDRRKEKDDPRKRRNRDEDDRHHQDRKRSRREESPPVAEQHSRRRSRTEPESKIEPQPLQQQRSMPNRSQEKSREVPSKGLDKDVHTLEREARNRERMQKEMQRRIAVEGIGIKGRESKGDGRTMGGRRVNYKYEDDESDETRAKRVEKEREAGRWD